MALRPIQQPSNNSGVIKRKYYPDDDVVCEESPAEWATARSKRQSTKHPHPLRTPRPALTPSGHLPVPESSVEHELCPSIETRHSFPINQSDHLAIDPLATATACNCGKPDNDAHGLVRCANAQCKVGLYHKSCVGLASRKDTSGWPCRDCRPKPPAPTLVPTQRQSSQNMPFSHSAQNMPNVVYDVPSEPSPLIAQGPPEPPLHPEQERVVRCIQQGDNVFYTGSAGTGKSTVLKALVQSLKKAGKQVDIVAPSGIAALNVGGMTIYAYAYWHPDAFKEPFEKLLGKAHGKNVRKRLCKTDVLVIDEISMVERDLLVRLDMIMREVRQGWMPEGRPNQKLLSPHDRKLPFGGAQVIVTGDFCQLPPVKPFRFCVHCGGDELVGWNTQDGRDLKCKRCPRIYADADKWAFRSQTWEDCKFTYFELKHIHRQNDRQFIDILQKCRTGKPLLPSEKSVLTTPKADPVGAVKLLPRRYEVDGENVRNFNSLKGTAREYECKDFFKWHNPNEPELKKKGALKYSHRPDGPLLALKEHRFEENVQLKIGMLVILLVNLDFQQGLVNGSQGKIVSFEKHDPSRSLVPRPSDSSSSRGARGSKNFSQAEELADFKEAQVREFIARAQLQEWPVIEFCNGVIRPIYACCQLNELGSEQPYSWLGRTQIPLLAAWAITIHKSQGMTLNRVILDLYNSFEREMVYVALSRARNLEGLKVIRLAKSMEQDANEEVQQFLRKHLVQDVPVRDTN